MKRPALNSRALFLPKLGTPGAGNRMSQICPQLFDVALRDKPRGVNSADLLCAAQQPGSRTGCLLLGRSSLNSAVPQVPPFSWLAGLSGLLLGPAEEIGPQPLLTAAQWAREAWV